MTARGWTFRSSIAERLRAWLAAARHVVALIGLPGIYEHTRIPLLLTVIDHAPPGPTLVGDLGDDWVHQLSGQGPLYRQLAPHLER